MTLKAFLLFFSILFLSFNSKAQEIDSIHYFQHDATKSLKPTAGINDEFGNLYIIGEMNGTVNEDYLDFDFGPDTLPVYKKGYYVIKYNPLYQIVWYRLLKPENNSNYQAAVSTVHSNKIIISGVFEDTLDLNPDTNQIVQHIGKNAEIDPT